MEITSTSKVTYTRVAYYGEAKQVLSVTDLKIDDLDYGSVMLNVATNEGKALLTWLTDNGVLIPVDSATVTADHLTSSDYIALAKADLQNIIDAVARVKDYDDGATCASYANSTNKVFKQDAKDFIAWRDECWATYFDAVNKFQSNEITLQEFNEKARGVSVINWTNKPDYTNKSLDATQIAITSRETTDGSASVVTAEEYAAGQAADSSTETPTETASSDSAESAANA